MKHLIEYVFIFLLSFFAKLFPWRFLQITGRLLGYFFYYILPVRKKVCIKNLSIAFKNTKSNREIEKISKRVYINIGQTLMEMLAFDKINKNNFNKFLTINHPEYLYKIRDEKKGALLITAHFGNWELMGCSFGLMDLPVDFITGTLKNPYIDKMLNNARRAKLVGIIPVKDGIKSIMTSLRKGRLVAILPDQDPGKTSIPLRFLGQPAYAPRGPAVFARKFNSPILLGFMIRDKNGHLNVNLVEPLYFKKTDNEEYDLARITYSYYSILEKFIMDYPDHWLWLHKRWKRIPTEEEIMETESLLRKYDPISTG